MLDRKASDIDLMLCQPIGLLLVKGLEAGGVADQPVADPAYAPHDHGTERDDDHDGNQDCYRQRDQLGYSGLQRALQRPSDSYGKDGAGDRCQEIGGGLHCSEDKNRGADGQHTPHPAIRYHLRPFRLASRQMGDIHAFCQWAPQVKATCDT